MSEYPPLLRRIMISLEDKDRYALSRMAKDDMRPPKWFVVWLIREEAKRRGIWEGDDDESGS